jgi:outer membrane receptor protein involved in Fe transport
LSVIADYAIKNANETVDITESSIGGNANNFINNDNNGKVISITPVYKIAWKKYYGNIGAKYSYLNSHSLTKWRSRLNEDYSQVSEHAGGAYMIFGAHLPFADIRSGLRLEYTSSEIQYEEQSNNLTRNYLNLFPNLSISKKVNNHFSLTAYYRRTISRPKIDHLSTTVIYRDSLYYQTGNPRLKPSYTDALNFTVNWRAFDLSLGYRIAKDKSTWEFIPDSSNPDRTIYTQDNMKEKTKVFTAELSHLFAHRVFNSITTITCEKYNLSLLFNNEIIRFNKPVYSIKHSGNLKIFKNTNLDYEFDYSTPGDEGYIQFNKLRGRFEAGISQHLFDRKLMISFYVYHILENNKRNNRWTSYSINNNIAVRQDDRNPDGRYVAVTVRYNFGRRKSIQQKTSDTDHIGRL